MTLDSLSQTPPIGVFQASNRDVLSKHATEFEGMLLSQWFESAERTFASPPDQSLDPAADTLSGIGATALGMQLARSHALGIGDMIARSLSSSSNRLDSANNKRQQNSPNADARE